jgi:hypothetical protein
VRTITAAPSLFVSLLALLVQKYKYWRALCAHNDSRDVAEAFVLSRLNYDAFCVAGIGRS